MSRLVIVTGAGSGIGRATARRFAENDDRVLLVGRREDRLREVAAELRQGFEKSDVEVFAADMADVSSVARLREHVRGAGRPVGGLVCCAGAGPRVGGDRLEQVVEEWDQSYRANVLTAVLAVEGLEPLLADGGSVVLFSSIAAYRGSGGTGAYGAAKAALHSYAHTLATRLGPRGINVNVVAPGYVGDTEFFGGDLPEERKAVLVGQTALGRPGMPQDVAELGFFLCSDAGAYITSQVLQINGGSYHGV